MKLHSRPHRMKKWHHGSMGCVLAISSKSGSTAINGSVTVCVRQDDYKSYQKAQTVAKVDEA
jgi:hypothetical protein